jgi:hypothetical protein
MIEAKPVYSHFDREKMLKEMAQKMNKVIRQILKEDKQKEVEEVLAKFEKKVGAEQLAENIKLYHGIKK